MINDLYSLCFTQNQFPNPNAGTCFVIMSWLMIPNASVSKTNKFQLVDIVYIDHWFDSFLFLAVTAFRQPLYLHKVGVGTPGQKPTCKITLDMLL